MAEKTVTVTIEPAGETVQVPAGSTVREAAAQAGVVIYYPCGGEANCGKCKVHVNSPSGSVTEAERTLLRPEELKDGVRLACQTVIDASVTVEIPESSTVSPWQRVLEWSDTTPGEAADPPVRKIPVELQAPTLEDDAPDLERLRRALGPVTIDLGLLRELPGRLRAARFQGTAVLAGDHLIEFEPGDTSSQCFAAAFDIGTTTLVGVIHDLAAACDCASASRINPQTSLGDDVLSRIMFASKDRAGLERLHKELIDAINDMLGELAEEAGVPPERIYEISLAGNTTMQHLLACLDPAALGQAPFVPAVKDSLFLPAAELGIRIHPCGRAYVFPVIGGFVGGDTVAGILATGLANATASAMFLDIGTNGEVVVCSEGRLVAASCAAGPAFEGARITHGMRAAAGAIEAVLLTDDVSCCVIGNVPPLGLCGSALIDLLAELLRHGLITPEGRLLGPDHAPSGLAGSLRQRLVNGGDKLGFLLARGEETQTGQPIVLYQRDIRELQLAIGAIRAAIAIMLRRASLKASDLDCLLVGGAFGNYIRCENAQRIGLLPAELDPQRVVFLGNTALAGARRAAVSQNARHQAAELAQRTEHLDLSRDSHFQDTFVESMVFPAAEEQDFKAT